MQMSSYLGWVALRMQSNSAPSLPLVYSYGPVVVFVALALLTSLAGTFVWQSFLVHLLSRSDSQHMVRTVKCWLVRGCLQRAFRSVFFHPSASQLRHEAQ